MQINRQELVKALAQVKPGLANKEVIEFTTHFVFDNDIVQTYNDQISIQRYIKTELKGAVSANEFFSLVDKLSDEVLNIEVDNDMFVIEGERSKARINIIREHNLPLLYDSCANLKWSPLPDDFSEAVKFCLFSVGKDMTRPNLTNLYITEDNIFATDKYRLTKRTMNAPIKTPFLLPGNAGTHLINYKPIHYNLQKEWLHFINEDKTIFSTRIMNLDYPDLNSFLKVEGETIKFPSSLIKSIDRAEILARTEFEQDTIISLSCEKSILTCRGEGRLGDIEETHQIRYLGPEVRIHINPIFLKEILSHLNNVVLGERTLLFEGENFKHAIALATKFGESK